MPGITPPSRERKNQSAIESTEIQKPETITAPEITKEKEEPKVSSIPEDRELITVVQGLKQAPTAKKTLPPIPQVRDALVVRIEKIMEEHFADAYAALPEVKKQEFKLKGEETAYTIRQLLNKTRIKIKKVFHLILEWLLLLPGINRFYLEQEAKIKADKIMALKKRIE